ncbi:MAG: peptide chain release factor N(5)-glutamine methyltransferase [Myxococcota bacterium]
MTAPATISKKTWTILELLRWTSDHFAARGIESARLDAELLLAHVMGVDRLRLYLDFEESVGAADRARYRELVRSRADRRVPVAQLVGRKEFWSLSLKVGPDVLVPRPDTETLVVVALERLPDPDAPARVLDLCTGSGAVALAIALERPRAHLVASDISQAALEIARENADEHGVADRIRWAVGPLFEPLAGQRFDLIVSNPPYVAEKLRCGLPPELAHEPEMALFAGTDGTDVLIPLIAAAPEHLLPGGILAVELDPAQASRAGQWCGEAGLEDVRVQRDLAQRPRVVSARRPAGAELEG